MNTFYGFNLGSIGQRRPEIHMSALIHRMFERLLSRHPFEFWKEMRDRLGIIPNVDGRTRAAAPAGNKAILLSWIVQS